MKPPLSAATLAYAAVASAVVPTEATKRSPAIYAYCIGCTEWKDSAPKESDSSSLQVAVKTTVPTSAFRSEFIPWPTTASRQEFVTASLVDVEDLHLKENRLLEVDSNTLSRQLVTIKAASHDQLLAYLSKQPSGEEFFLLLFLLVAAIVITYGGKGDKLSSSGSDEDSFDLIELTPTIDEEDDEQHDDDSDMNMRTIQTKSILLGSISSGGKCVVKSKTKKRVHFQEPLLQEEAYRKEEDEVCNNPIPYHDNNGSSPSRYTCNNTFQDKLSGKILKLLLDDNDEEMRGEMSEVKSSLPNNTDLERGDEQLSTLKADIPSTTLGEYESDGSESGIVDSSMLNEYEDFLFQVKQSFL